MSLRKIATGIACLFSALLFTNCQPEDKEPPFLMGQGPGLHSATLLVNDIEEAIAYYQDTLGFNVGGAAGPGVFQGALSKSISFNDMTAFELLSVNDSLQNETPGFIKSFLESAQGVRLFTVSSSSLDSTATALTTSGYAVDSIQSIS